MQTRRENILTQPALIPIAGNFDRKPRSIDRDVTTVGRARGTDLCLEANEISTLHCVLYRTGEQYRIRDCNSRSGTRINGTAVKSQTLHDGDIVNLGPFSFEFRIPPALFPNAKVDPVRIEHWKSSRRKLANFALKLRNRLQGSAPREQEWAQKAHLLKEKIRSYDQRLSELEDAETELTQEREQIAREMESHRQRVQQQEGQLANRFAEADREIRQRWQEFQQRCQAEEASLNTARPADAGPLQDAHADRERQRQLEEHLKRQQALLEREQQEFTTMKEQWVKAQTKSSEALEEQQATLAQQEAAVRAQKAELLRMMAELKKMQEELRKQPRADATALQDEVQRVRQENTELRGLLEELHKQNESALGGPTSDDVQRQLTELRAEVDLLNEELTSKEATLRELQTHHAGAVHPAAADELSAVQAENALLKKLLDEKTKFAEELSAEAPKNEGDLERYEAELNDMHGRQVEIDRGKLNAELEMMRVNATRSSTKQSVRWKWRCPKNAPNWRANGCGSNGCAKK